MRTIVFIHGMWMNKNFWSNYIDFFGHQYNCITITLPHHSDNSENVGGVSFREYIEYCENFIQKLNLNKKPIIIGHSMGGLIAQKLASCGVASKIVCLSPAAPAGIFSLRWSVIKSFSSALRWGFWKNPHRPTFDEAVYSMLHLLSNQEQNNFYSSMTEESMRVAAEIGFWMFDPYKSTTVGEINCPILVIAGSQDRITPASVIRKVAKKYKADYVEFPNHAHLITHEKSWEKVAMLLHAWLQHK